MKFAKRILMICLILTVKTGLKAQVAQIPFEFNGTHLFIKVQVNQNDSLNFVFDSGATGMTIDSLAAEHAGISKNNGQVASIAGSGGVQNYVMALHQNIKLGDVELKNIDMVLINFASLSTSTGSKIEGIIGYEVLNKYVTKLDFDHKKILLYDQIKAVDTTGYTGIPFEFNRGVLIPRFPISITLANEETFTGRVMFDTGSIFTLIVSPPFSKFHDFNSKLGETTTNMSRGLSFTTQDQLAGIKSMSFNGFSFGEMPIRLTINDKAEPKDGYLGILGIEVIKRFNVILDYANKKIYLKPNLSYHDAFNRQDPGEKIKQESIFFLEKNKKQPGVVVMPSGLQYKIIRQGKGPKPTMQDRVTLQYTAKLINGKEIWSTYAHKKPWVHHLDKAFAGLQEGVMLMPQGSKWILYIPASLAFGNAGDQNVPAGAALVYEVEVLESDPS
ncbi:FKBP-type peptidyl-prolyl cis-trans isomerase [Pedobacter cryoconitis]|uniref:FKBP-type peptidyl-prolyl cis-trans isomerase n=1 Tax=Pedobacter cryoconitis TaxID=188932 RepID=UPI0016153D7A|nr:FKBP-type peptidyl-prolyl cis-trans isomerase [Pedobacter cryoconitis]MBB6270526.1 FKBP-type peptidyl-prolyl cis-trans isomerase [Pedobacter cryoconitis]